MNGGICFLSYCPNFGGVSSFQGYHLGFLAGSVHVGLADEFPEFTLQRLPEEARERVATLEVPLWSQPSSAAWVLEDWLVARGFATVVINNPGLLVRQRRPLRRAAARGINLVLMQHSGFHTLTPRRMALELAIAALSWRGVETVYVADYTRRYWQMRYPWLRAQRYRVVPNAVPIEAERREQRTGVRRAAFVGRLDREKGAELFCRIAAASVAAGKVIDYHAYGDGPLLGQLRERYGSVVTFHGAVSDPGLLFENADLLVMTSPIENSPFALLEAKTRGIPTVAAAVGGIPEIMRDRLDGVFATELTATAFLEAINRADSIYPALVEGCLHSRHGFDIERVGARLWAPYLNHLD